jgi:hypothetical protein
MAKRAKATFHAFKCPDCGVEHRWERLGVRSNLLLRKRGISGQNYGWKTVECHGPTARDGRLYTERVTP